MTSKFPFLRLDRVYGEPHGRDSKSLTRIYITMNNMFFHEFIVCTGHDGSVEENKAEEMWNSLCKCLKITDEPYPQPHPITTYGNGRTGNVKMLSFRKTSSEVYLNGILIKTFNGLDCEIYAKELFDKLLRATNAYH